MLSLSFIPRLHLNRGAPVIPPVLAAPIAFIPAFSVPTLAASATSRFAPAALAGLHSPSLVRPNLFSGD